MAFTASQMETAWSTVLNSTFPGDTEWCHLVVGATGGTGAAAIGEYYRFLVAQGHLMHWNRTAGTWDLTSTVPAGLINVQIIVS